MNNAMLVIFLARSHFHKCFIRKNQLFFITFLSFKDHWSLLYDSCRLLSKSVIMLLHHRYSTIILQA